MIRACFLISTAVGGGLQGGHASKPLARVGNGRERNSSNGDRDGKEDSMNARKPSPRILVIVGGIAMLLGTIDLLEGSLLILATRAQQFDLHQRGSQSTQPFPTSGHFALAKLWRSGNVYSRYLCARLAQW